MATYIGQNLAVYQFKLSYNISLNHFTYPIIEDRIFYLKPIDPITEFIEIMI